MVQNKTATSLQLSSRLYRRRENIKSRVKAQKKTKSDKMADKWLLDKLALKQFFPGIKCILWPTGDPHPTPVKQIRDDDR